MYVEVVDTRHKRLINRVRQLLRQLFASESVLQLVSSSAIAPIESYTEGRIDNKLAPNVPVFGMIIQNLTTNEPRLGAVIVPRLKALALQVAFHSRRISQDLTLHHTVITQRNAGVHRGDEREWEITGCFYDKDLERARPYYEGRDNDKSPQGRQLCQKYYEM